MVSNGVATPRGSTAGMRRRRTAGSGGGGAAGGGINNMLQLYADDAACRKISPNAVLVMSISFVGIVSLLHVVGKLYLLPHSQQ